MTNKKYHVNHHDRQRFLGRKKSSIEVAVGIYLVSLIPVNFQFPNVMQKLKLLFDSNIVELNGLGI